MARVVYGQGVSDFKGRIGGTVFSRNPSGSYARNINHPAYKATSRRVNNIPDFNTITQLWFELVVEWRLAWDAFAAGHTWTDSFGIVSHPTGLNIFISINSRRIAMGLTPFSYPPAYSATPAATTFIMNYLESGYNILRDANWANTDLVTVVNVTPPMSRGSRYFKNKIRQIAILPHPQAEWTCIQSDLDNYFGCVYPEAFVYPAQNISLAVWIYHIKKSTGIIGLGQSYNWDDPEV